MKYKYKLKDLKRRRSVGGKICFRKSYNMTRP